MPCQMLPVSLYRLSVKNKENCQCYDDKISLIKINYVWFVRNNCNISKITDIIYMKITCCEHVDRKCVSRVACPPYCFVSTVFSCIVKPCSLNWSSENDSFMLNLDGSCTTQLTLNMKTENRNQENIRLRYFRLA